jgi:chromosome segregation ATPase
MDALETVQRDNKILQEDIIDLQDQVSESIRSTSELERAKREMEVEINCFQAQFEESEAAVETEENKILRAQMDLNQIKTESEMRLREKEDDIDSAKRNATRTIDALQHSLDSEIKARSESIRLRKKLEGDFADIEVQLAHSNRQNTDFQRQVKDVTAHIKENEIEIDEAQRNAQEVDENFIITNKRCEILSKVFLNEISAVGR